LRETRISDKDVKSIVRGGKKNDTVFTVTLMMANQRGEKDDDFTHREEMSHRAEKRKLKLTKLKQKLKSKVKLMLITVELFHMI
jgi:hypothetical protein